MMMLVLTVCSFEGTWNIDRNEKQCESAVFFLAKKSNFLTKKRFCYMYISDEDCVFRGKNAGDILDKSI
jgi:hypothetical protein